MELTRKGSRYTDEERRSAAACYLVLGNMSKVSDQTGIPRRTIAQWSKTEWWITLCSQLRQQTEADILAKNEQIIRSAQEQVIDRLEHGDHQIVRRGDAYETRRIPMKGKDIAVIGAIAQDKRRLALNLPTSIRGDQASSESLKDLARRFAQLSNSFEEKRAHSIEGRSRPHASAFKDE